MSRILAALCAASLLSLSACAGTLPDRAPAPLAATAVDDKALVLALQAFDTALDTVDILKDAGYIEPGSETALQIATVIDTTKAALQAASAAQRAGSTTEYAEAISYAQDSAAALGALINSIQPGS